MLSGSRPRGSRRTPVNGKIGRMSGSANGSTGPGWSLIARPLRSRKHQRREAPAGAQRQRIGRPHDLKEFDQLAARRLIIPVAVALEEREEFVDRGLAVTGAKQRGGEFKTRLVVVLVGLQALAQFADRAHRLLRLLGEFERGVR